MRYLVAALGGFALTLGAFVGGVGFAIAYLTAEPVPVQKPAVDVAMLWPSDPVKVDTRMQDFNRIERRPVVQPSTQGETQADINETTTASVDDLPTSEPVTQSYNHITWCTNRYRSYQSSDNSFMSFSGFKRECSSPFSPATGSADDQAVHLEASAAAESFDSLYQHEVSAAYPNSDHIESCFIRYRSYRPEDNSYQPYGGGPRQQCQ